MINKESTRYYSNEHEKSICKALGGYQNSNSGAGKFTGGDITISASDMLIEAKCSMTEKTSFSIKKQWLDKIKEEAFETGKSNTALCFRFSPNSPNYYIIDEKLMKYLVDKIREDLI